MAKKSMKTKVRRKKSCNKLETKKSRKTREKVRKSQKTNVKFKKPVKMRSKRKSTNKSKIKSSRKACTAAAEIDENLFPGIIVTLIKPKLNWKIDPKTISAYYSGTDNDDNRHFFQIKEEDDEYIDDNIFDPFFHIKHDGKYEIQVQKQSNIKEKLLENREKLDFYRYPMFDFSSSVGLLEKGEVGGFTGLIMCIGVVIHNKKIGDILAFHYVAPNEESQDNRQKAFNNIENAMEALNWYETDCEIYLFMKINKSVEDAVNRAVKNILDNFGDYKFNTYTLDKNILSFEHNLLNPDRLKIYPNSKVGT